MRTYYLASMNDALFIIDQPPHPSTDPGPAHHKRGPTFVEPWGADRVGAEKRLAELNAASPEAA